MRNYLRTLHILSGYPQNLRGYQQARWIACDIATKTDSCQGESVRRPPSGAFAQAAASRHLAYLPRKAMLFLCEGFWSAPRVSSSPQGGQNPDILKEKGHEKELFLSRMRQQRTYEPDHYHTHRQKPFLTPIVTSRDQEVIRRCLLCGVQANLEHQRYQNRKITFRRISNAGGR
jgi:hypothetical protein